MSATMKCPHCMARIDLHLALGASEGCGMTCAAAPTGRRPKLTEEERLQRRKEVQQLYYQNHKEERREKHLAYNRAYYRHNREGILERLRLKRAAAKEVGKAAEEASAVLPSFD